MSRASGMTSANVGRSPKPGEMRLDRHAGAAHRVTALPPDRHDREVARSFGDLARREPDRVRVQRTGQTTVGRDQHDQPLATFAFGEQRMVFAAEHGGEVGQDLVDHVAVRTSRQRRVLGTLQLRGSNELHRPRDLLDVPDGADPPPDITLGRHRRSAAALLGPWRRCRLRALAHVPRATLANVLTSALPWTVSSAARSRHFSAGSLRQPGHRPLPRVAGHRPGRPRHPG